MPGRLSLQCLLWVGAGVGSGRGSRDKHEKRCRSMGVIQTRGGDIQAKGGFYPGVLGMWPGMGTGMGMGA
jgi:hypothetical protein